jgi:hypothetical protein
MMDDHRKQNFLQMRGKDAAGKIVSTGASMPSVRNCFLASIAIAVTLGGTLPASAGRQVRADDVARVLSGKAFHIECVDGTQGRGQFSTHGAVSVAYRRASGTPEEVDHANMRVRGVEICLSWNHFGGGGTGCYPVYEQTAGRFRLGSGPIWCDISPK